MMEEEGTMLLNGGGQCGAGVEEFLFSHNIIIFCGFLPPFPIGKN